ncbi:Uncharacterized protein APZ42_014575 [Daphnia magna]|uniref:Uncharacterized protein n=1 Tax=Daphnia magna TaxID=35525 RepID=A0A162PQA9_9CRUS|nr:Uncharacterized protein APZ42_014575 [Daphnia magna]
MSSLCILYECLNSMRHRANLMIFYLVVLVFSSMEGASIGPSWLAIVDTI